MLANPFTVDQLRTEVVTSQGCGVCRRKMQESWNNGKPHYRCQFLSEYPAKNQLDHPISVYLREDNCFLISMGDWPASATPGKRS